MGKVVCGTDHSKFLNVQLFEEIPQDDLVNQGASDLSFMPKGFLTMQQMLD